MHNFAFPSIDASAAFRCSDKLRQWLVELMVWFCTEFARVPKQWRRLPLWAGVVVRVKAKVAADLRFSVRVMRRMLLVAALARFRPRHPQMHRLRFSRARAGLRAMHPNRFWRRATVGILSGVHEGSLKARALRLREALDRFDALVARVLARLHAVWRCPAEPRLVLTASRVGVISRTPAHAVAVADSS